MDPYIDLTVRLLPGGAVSTILTEEVQVGQEINLRGPYGRFVLENRRMLWIAGGSGIAPFRSMWRYIEQTGSPADFTLLYSTKSAGLIIYRSELEALSQRRKVFHTLTAEIPPAWPGLRGRVDEKMLTTLISDFAEPLFYVCGPPALCDDVARSLRKLGTPRANIRTEKYD